MIAFYEGLWQQRLPVSSALSRRGLTAARWLRRLLAGD